MQTDFSKITFNAKWHKYYYNGIELTSVTKKLREIQKPFDREGIAARMASKNGKSVELILAEWDAKGEAARQKGTLVHEHIEKLLKDELPPQPTQFDFTSLNSQLLEMKTAEHLIKEKLNWLKVSSVEMVIGDRAFGLAGTVDTLFFDPETNHYHIFDWKTGKFSTDNEWENLLSPFSTYPASKFHIYSLQISLYHLILKRNTALNLGPNYIVHLADKPGIYPDNYRIYKAIDFTSELSAWLNYDH